MTEPNEIPRNTPSVPPLHQSAAVPRGFWFAGVTVAIAFCWPLYQLVRLSLGSELYSHIILIPLISAYLVWQQRNSLPSPSSPQRSLAIAFFAVGAALMLAYGLLAFPGPTWAREDTLAVTTLAFLAIFSGACAWFLGRRTLRAVCFPLAFLLFMVPMPVRLVAWIDTLLQHGSAAVAHALFAVAGTNVFASGLVFQLSSITIQIAPECSGIRSSLALLVTSVLAGYFFLRSPGQRAILALAVLPLALLRNGFRVFVIGELCVHVGPEMIDSYIHHHGGPIFFALSLVPFFGLLVLLVKSERGAAKKMRV
jgi:exosortase C (VPDSG-CTERM-specific)